MNGGTAKSKTSKIEKRMFIYMMWLFLFQITLSLAALLARIIYKITGNNDFDDYLKANGAGLENFYLLTFLRYFVILNTFIPISLVVNLEVVRAVQAYFTTKNLELKSKERNM